ncbi:DnaJ C-terminal domain-containing protein [uncultured Thiothrix sp.]|uniref:DnaJ C-terminal domain-containing protein n=1 Tax=uncultured Thiothrix sp. TaxID=223185 RepID=UPI002638B88A|nr:DnaJ C-terminal domain-containing protein [uncultured Thiothrix sp.]HMT92059.1 DnaJ C-terminal domain-containing protein [Thiolinea sp.]
MEYKDYYKTLGVERSATADEIRAAYRKLARKYHPDVSKEKDAEERFKEVGEAYEVLKDTEKREAYDQLGSNWKQGQEFRPPPGWSPSGGAGFEFRSGQGGQADFSDFFSSIFGNMGGNFGGGGFNQQGFGQNAGTRQNTRGQDQQTKIQIDLEDSLQGAKRSISLRSASGDRTLTVNIPKGIKSGQKIRLNGQGQNSLGGAGDLLLEVEFNPHRLYKVEGSDLTMNLPVTPWEAALGATVKIPLPDGSHADVKIPANSRSGRKMRLKERGLPSKPAGDLYLILEIALPTADTPRAKELYEQMAKELAFNPRAHW